MLLNSIYIKDVYKISIFVGVSQWLERRAKCAPNTFGEIYRCIYYISFIQDVQLLIHDNYLCCGLNAMKLGQLLS